MSMRLDFWLFGNGRGIASPYHDDVLFWLADTHHARNLRGRHSRLYRFSFGFGAQLCSFEWRAPPAGTYRCLFGKKFVINSARRRWLRVICYWAYTGKLDNVDDVRALRAALIEWGHGK